jgi:hypothetical protein
MSFLFPKPKAPAQTPPTKLAGMHLTEAVIGKAVPIVMGTRRVPQSLIWYGDFTAIPHVQKTASGGGGKGLGGGGGSTQTSTTYTYTAATMGVLCSGPVSGILNVWDTKGRFSQTSVTESFTVPVGGGTYTVGNHGLFKVDRGVGFAQNFSQTVNDFGSPGSTTLTGTYQVPMTNSQSTRIQSSGGSSVLKYYFDLGLSTSGTIYNATVLVLNQGTQPMRVADNFGHFVTVPPGTRMFTPLQFTGNGTSNVQLLFQTNAAGDSLDIIVQNPSITKSTSNVNLIPSGNLNFSGWNTFGGATITLTQNVPMSAGQYATDGAGNYTFHAADAGKAVSISYSYNLLQINNVEDVTIPGSPFQVLVNDSADFLQDSGVVYYPSGTALTKVASSPTTGQYTVSSGGLYTFSAGDTAQQVQIRYITNTSNQNSDAQSALNLTLLPGTQSQAVWSYLTSRHPEAAIGYTETAIVASSAMDLGSNGEIPNYSFEIAGPYVYGSGIQDCDPTDCIGALLSDPYFGITFPTSAFGDWTGTSNFWVANSFFISPLLTSQTSVASTIGAILEAGMTAAFWSEGQLKLVPYGDTSAAGNGQIYIPNTQPVVDLNDNDFIGAGLVKVQRSAWQDANNKVQVTWSNRLNGYNNEVTTEQDDAAIQRYGLRQEDPQSWDFITTLAAAQFAANLRVKRSVNIRAQYTFSITSRYSYLEPMDLITITVPELGWTKLPVRISKIVNHPDENGLEITAEEFPWGTAQPTLYAKQTGAGFVPNAGQADPGNTSALIFEAPNRLAMQQGNILYGFVNGASPDWGGCQPFVSFDGTNYQPFGPQITAPARLGTLNTSLAAGTVDPDTSNFQVTMNSAGSTLPSLSTADFNQGTNICVLVDTTDNTPFELFSYKNATLVGANKWQLDTLHRGLMGTTNAAHSSGETFAVLDQASFTYQYDPSYYGKTIFFKFPSFNTVGGRPQPLSQAAVFSFALPGSGPGAIDLNTGIYRPGVGSVPNSWTGSLSFSSSPPGTSLTISWNIVLTRGTMPNPNQASNTLASQSYVGSQTVTGLTASTNYWVYPYIDDTQSGSPLLFVLNSQVSGATGTPAICYTSQTAGATFFQGRNDHVPLTDAPMLVSTAPTSGSPTGGSSPPVEGACVRGDMLVDHQTDGIIPASDLLLGDFIRYRNEWVQVVDLIHKMRRLWMQVSLDCGEDIVVTPTHVWPTMDGEQRTEHLKPGTLLFTDEGLCSVREIKTIEQDALCIHITVNHPDHCFNIGSRKPIAITHNGRAIDIS